MGYPRRRPNASRPRRELRQSLSGLDGLFDLRLEPHPRSPYTVKMANGLKKPVRNSAQRTDPAGLRHEFAWRVDAVTPQQIASAITDWFDRAGSAGLKLPNGWFGRPDDNQFRLTHATVADGNRGRRLGTTVDCLRSLRR